MITRQQVIDQARTWLDTPFHHQGRVKGVGVDCVGLVIGVAKELGLSDFDTTNYSRYPDVEMMGMLLNKHLKQIDKNLVKPGDIIWLKVKRSPQHLAMVTDKGIIHANGVVGKCVETDLDEATKRLIYGAFEIIGVQ
jgi:cell wall-associated NlpC family hydrolase